MTDIVLSTYPEMPDRTVAKLATQLWLQSFNEGETVLAWDKDAKASTKEVVATEIPADKVIVEYPVIFSEDKMTFTSTVILPQEDALFLVDQKIPVLSPLDYMAKNGGKSFQDSRYALLDLETVNNLAVAVDKGQSPLTGTEYLFGKEVRNDGEEDINGYLVLLFNQQSSYHLDTILADIFGEYTPQSLDANLKEEGDGLLSGEAEILESAYVGTINFNDPVVPGLTIIHFINLPLIADGLRDPDET